MLLLEQAATLIAALIKYSHFVGRWAEQLRMRLHIACVHVSLPTYVIGIWIFIVASLIFV